MKTQNTLLWPLFALLALWASGGPQHASAQTTEEGSREWRKTRPVLGPPPVVALPSFEKTVLPNGLTVLVTRQSSLPLVAFSLVTRGGAALDPPGQPGLGNLVYALLDEGAGDLDALAFSDAVADLGAGLGASCDRDRGSVSISGLRRHADALVGLLADVVRRPRLAPEDLERIKARTVAGIQAQLGSPQGIAFMQLPALIYGPSHPLGHPPIGRPDAVKKVTPEALRLHHSRLLAPERSAFIAVGDLTMEQAVLLATQAFGDWKVENAPGLEIPPVEPRNRKVIHFFDVPGSPQTMAVLARPLFGRGHPDEDALSLANRVFGGSFSSRLNMNLREDKGYTYGAGSQVAFRRGVGVFVAYAALQTVHSAAGVREFFVEIGRLDLAPIGALELDRAKKGIIRGLPGDFQGIGSLAGAAAQIFAYELPLDHYASISSRVQRTSLTDVQAAARRYIDPDLMAVLLVGDAQKVVPTLKEADLGPVEVHPPAQFD